MSKPESTFIKWLSIIAGSVIATMIIGLFGFYSMTIRFEERTTQKILNIETLSERNNKSLKDMHNKDINYILKDIKEIKLGQREVLNLLVNK